MIGTTLDLESYAKRHFNRACQRAIRSLVEVYLRVVAQLPLDSVRILGFRLAGATFGEDVVLKHDLRLVSPWKLCVGSHTNIGRHVDIGATGTVTIGDNCNISDQVAIWSGEHDISSSEFAITRAPVIVEDHVWICFRAMLLPGVRLGEGCVVAAGAVVTKSMPPFSLVAGIPATIIGSRPKGLRYQLGRDRA